MNKFNFDINPVTTYCSKECYEREVKKFIWDYQYELIKKEFKSLLKHLYRFLYLVYKFYLKDILISILGVSILLLAYLTLNYILYTVEKYIN